MRFFGGFGGWLHKRTPGEQQRDLFSKPGDPVQNWFAIEQLETNPDKTALEPWESEVYQNWQEQVDEPFNEDFLTGVGVLLDPQESTSFEDRLNARRLQSLRERFSQRLMNALLEGDFEYGYESEADRIVAAALEENVLATKSWLGELFREYFADVTVICGLLHIFSRLDHRVIEPEGEIFATAAIAHQNLLVKECAIRCFESWSQPSSVPILENLELHEPWLESYRKRVLEDIQREVCSSSLERSI